tara:strand:- start:245 stop:433 length:189 start_codon:yes stop_codon:yes gene_type:complete
MTEVMIQEDELTRLRLDAKRYDEAWEYIGWSGFVGDFLSHLHNHDLCYRDCADCAELRSEEE